MTDFSRIREFFEAQWQRLDEEETRTKLANHALIELQKVYSALSPDDRIAVDSLLAEWVLCDDVRKQFDSEALINRFTIRSALPALRLAKDATAGAADAPTVYRRAKLGELIVKLERPGAGAG